MLNDGRFKDALASGKADLIWDEVDNYLISQGYPEKDINELRYVLEVENILIPPGSATLLNTIENDIPDNADSMSDLDFANVIAKIIKKNKNKITSDNTNFLSGVAPGGVNSLMRDISDLMESKKKK
jgi:hypothetical protein